MADCFAKLSRQVLLQKKPDQRLIHNREYVRADGMNKDCLAAELKRGPETDHGSEFVLS